MFNNRSKSGEWLDGSMAGCFYALLPPLIPLSSELVSYVRVWTQVNDVFSLAMTIFYTGAIKEFGKVMP